MNDNGKTNRSGKRLEQFTKRASRSLLARLSSVHRKHWHSIGNTESIRRIIVIRQHNQFGDVLCTVPLLRALRSKFKLDELTVVVSPQNKDALAGCKYATSLINYDKLSFYRKPSLFLKFVRELRKEYDVLLVPSNVSISLTNDVMAFFAKAKTKIGPRSLDSKSNRTSSVYDVAVDLEWEDKIVHQAHRHLKIVSPLGIGEEDDNGELEYEVDERVLNEVRGVLTKAGTDSLPRIAIHAGAGKSPNRWNVVNFALLSELLHRELNAELYFTEGPMDHDVIDNLVNIVKVPFVRIRNRTISFIAAFLKRMNLVITNDTGIMHLSAAVGTPTLSLFGPTDPLQWAPIGKKQRFILGSNKDIQTIPVEKVIHLTRKMLH